MPNLKRLANVQALRALAAIAVIVGHSGGMNIIHVPPMLQACGYSGVDVFFVISGFIISQTAIRPNFSRADAGAFLLRRYWRIYPLYWIALIAVVVFSRNVLPLQYPLVACNKPQAHYLLLLTQSNCWIPPAWTLKFELYFYTAFAAALLVAPRRVFPVITVAMCGQLLAVYTAGSAQSNDAFFTSPLILEFGFGCGVAWLHHKRLSAPIIPVLAIGVLVFAVGPYVASTQEPKPLFRTFSFGLGAAFILYAALMAEVRGLPAAPRFLQQLGDASYSIYLWHWPIITLCAKAALGWYTVAIAVAFGVLSYLWIERPLLQIGRRWWSPIKSPATQPLRS